MGNIIRKTTELALHIVSAYIMPGDAVIDATCGNGHDTLALAGMDPARLYAFDIQEEAVEAARKLLEDHGYCDKLDSGCFCVQRIPHEELGSFFAGPDAKSDNIKAVIFNLGYLPGGDKSITTNAGSTLAAVRAAMDLVCRDGIICITIYSGHEEGKHEKTALLNFAGGLDPHKWHTAYISMPNQQHDPPEILLITRK